MLWIFAATGTAVAFACSSLVAFGAARTLGGVVFSFLRTSLASAGFGAAIAVTGWYWSLTGTEIVRLAASGVTGVFAADSLRYAALVRLGPRVNALVQVTSVPFSLACGAAFLGESISGMSLFGTLIIVVGIVAALDVRGHRIASVWEGESKNRAFGLLLGLASALCFSVSLLVAAPVMAAGADPICATAVRALAGSAATLLPVVLVAKNRLQIATLHRSTAAQVAASGVLGTGIGLTAQLYALAHEPVGIVSALSSMTPVILVPLVWLVSRRRPTAAAWLGAVLGVVGVALIFASVS